MRAYSRTTLNLVVTSTPPGGATPALIRTLWLTLLIGIAYAALGIGALALAGPPGYASPLFPPAGLALAVALTYGRSALPGVWLGSFLVNVSLGWVRGQSGLGLVLLPSIIALGALIQAGVAAALVRRFAGPVVVMNSPREIALAGLFGGPVGCLVSASLGTLALFIAGAVPASALPSNWATWWSGDTLGALIATPLFLALMGRPAADWRPRIRTVGIPLLIMLTLVSTAVFQLNRIDAQRQVEHFERDADLLAGEVQQRLAGAMHALQALSGAFAKVKPGAEESALRDVSQWWLGQKLYLQAMGYSQRLSEAAVPAFEADVRAGGLPGFRVFDQDEGADRRQRGEVVAIRAVAPSQGNASALGVNALSIPQARDAILASRLNGEPVATRMFRLTQFAQEAEGIVLYQAQFAGQPSDAAERQALFTGVVFVTLRADSAFAELLHADHPHVRWCLRSVEAAGASRRLAGAQGCEVGNVSQSGFKTERGFNWAGLDLRLAVHADQAAIAPKGREAAWLLELSGVMAVAMLGALLLTVTGHTRRTELAVRAGTQELLAENNERQQAEQALRESSERFRSIFDNVPLGIMFLDTQGHLIEANARTGALTGLRASDLVGRSVATLVHPDDTELIRRMRRELVQGQAMSTVDAVRLQTVSGNLITVRVSATAMRSPQGQALRMVAVVEDITEHLRLEASDRALQNAEAANRAKSEFLSRMSHELRTPLNAMIGFAQLLGLDREPGLSTHQLGWTQQIQRAGWHLLELINETLDLARIEAGAVRLKLEALHLEPMIAACQSMVAGQAEQRQVRFREQFDPAAAGVVADATRLKQVLTNLLSNAVKYNRAGGEVFIRTALSDGGRVEISIQDTGIGMTPEQVSLLFQPYNRLGMESSDIEGTGIGLVITRRLTELMQGQLSVTSVVAEGSTFVLSLPASEGAVAPPPVYTETSPAPYQQRHVHYVEDNETNIEVMRGVLAQRAQIVLKTSGLGLDGWSAIRRDRPDLILLDMHLPDISGLELLRHLKQDDEVAEIPVIVVSADATNSHVQQALTLGALHYVTKPVDVVAFLALVDSALESADTRWGV